MNEKIILSNWRSTILKIYAVETESTTLPRTESINLTEVTIESISIFLRAPNPCLWNTAHSPLNWHQFMCMTWLFILIRIPRFPSTKIDFHRQESHVSMEIPILAAVGVTYALTTSCNTNHLGMLQSVFSSFFGGHSLWSAKNDNHDPSPNHSNIIFLYHDRFDSGYFSR